MFNDFYNKSVSNINVLFGKLNMFWSLKIDQMAINVFKRLIFAASNKHVIFIKYFNMFIF